MLSISRFLKLRKCLLEFKKTQDDVFFNFIEIYHSLLNAGKLQPRALMQGKTYYLYQTNTMLTPNLLIIVPCHQCEQNLIG